MSRSPAASLIRQEIIDALIADHPRYRTYWECRAPAVVVHPDWLGSNWTWSVLADPADTQLIARVVERVRKRFPRVVP